LEAELIRREQSRAREHAAALAELEAERQKMRAANTRLGQLAGELQRLRAAMVAEMRAEASEILLQGARRLAHESLRADESLLAAMAIDAAAALGGDERVVRVNPDDVAALEGQLGDRFKVVADPKIEAGCIVEGHGGSIEATVEAAAAALRADTEAWRRAG
jgi:flagellar biosynthesis/type III secretory pathway protein FliH